MVGVTPAQTENGSCWERPNWPCVIKRSWWALMAFTVGYPNTSRTQRAAVSTWAGADGETKDTSSIR